MRVRQRSIVYLNANTGAFQRAVSLNQFTGWIFSRNIIYCTLSNCVYFQKQLSLQLLFTQTLFPFSPQSKRKLSVSNFIFRRFFLHFRFRTNFLFRNLTQKIRNSTSSFSNGSESKPINYDILIYYFFSN